MQIDPTTAEVADKAIDSFVDACTELKRTRAERDKWREVAGKLADVTRMPTGTCGERLAKYDAEAPALAAYHALLKETGGKG